MSQPLTRTEQQLQNRYLALANRLNQDLGFKDGRLRFAKRSTRSDSVAYLLQTSARTEQGLPADSVCTIGLSGRYPVSMHLASYAEPRVSPYRKGFLSWVHRVHLPVRAMWHAQVCAMPNDAASHQHEPTTVDEVDSWILSAVRYLRHEFDTYA